MKDQALPARIRIGISGPGGSGKTSLVEMLSRILGFPSIAEGVNAWLEANDAVHPWSLSYEQQLGLQQHVVAYKIAHENGLDAFVSDRTTVDAVSLLVLRLERLREPVPGRLCADALNHARMAYDVAFILGPQRVSPEHDDVALLDPTLRVREHELTMSLYQSIGIPSVRVPILPLAERGAFVRTALEERARMTK